MKLRITMFLLVLAGAGLPAQEPLAEAVRLFEEGRHAEAETLFRERARGNDPDAYLYLGRIQAARQDWESAADSLKLAVKIREDHAESQYWLGKVTLERLKTANFMEKGVLAGRVLDHLKRAIQLEPGHIGARTRLAHYYFNAPSIAGGSRKKALEQARAVTDLAPERGRPLLAGFYRGMKEYDKAITTYRAHLKASPGDKRVLYALGVTCQMSETYEEAFAVFEKLLANEPGHLGALYQIGKTSALSGRQLARGGACLRQYMQGELPSNMPSKAAAHWRLGMIHQHGGDLVQARTCFQKAVDLEPEEAMFRETLDALNSQTP